MKTTNRRICLAIILGVALFPEPLRAERHQGTAPVDFSRQILPVLSNKCFVCHGPDGTEREVLRLDSFAAATLDLGGHLAIDPDAPEKSEILVRVFSTDDPMPPQDAEKQLTAAERELLARWIRAGGEYTTHWSFIPPQKKLPAGSHTATISEIIDAFVRARLQAAGIDFAPAAERATLARRAALVLTGLPPEPEQLAHFLADHRPDAYERLVDELLASPRFGEHQARYWLDAVRYGDTHGLHLDNRRGIYPYRDWVIHALNKNLPLDKFFTWQLAGDLLPNPTLEQRAATGFVRLNPTTGEGGAIAEEFQAKNNFDRVETLGTVFLGMSLTCARCHTHKYDPIPQTEYYRLFAFFNSTAENALDGNKYDYAPVVRAPSSVGGWNKWSELKSARDRILADAELRFQEQHDIDPDTASKWTNSNATDRLAIVADPQGPFAGSDPKATRSLEVPGSLNDHSPRFSNLHQQAIELNRRIAELEKTFTTTLVAEDLPKPRATRLLNRGEYDLPTGDQLEPGAPTVMGGLPDDAPRNRLGLARWLTSREHPLVARVLINRVWQQTFGEGLVRTPEDFGLQGQQPTHPMLLDWLAAELQDSGWDLKQMLRLLITSRTFRQRSARREDVDDPENRLLARGPRHRLDAEVIRDIGLWASGLLDPHMGGEGTKPYQPGGLWSALMHPASNTKEYVRDNGQQLYHRSLYVYWKRTCPHPMLTLFDAPSRESSCVKRSRTNTSLQSLGLLNETQRIEMSRIVAQRLIHEARDDTARLDLLFSLLSCRAPTDVERSACTSLLQTMRARYSDAQQDALALLSTGDAPRDPTLNIVEHAAWSQVAATVLASDVAILLY